MSRGDRAAGIVLFLLSLVLLSCRTTLPQGEPFAPLTSTTEAEAREQLAARRTEFHGARSLMRVRATANGKTQSFRAQLVVHNPSKMELFAYTPVGTTAMTLRADGDHVVLDNALEGTHWEGSARELGGSFGLLGTALTPAEMSMLILGIPPASVEATVAPAGVTGATLGDVAVTFDPPAFPSKQVTITRGADRIEIEQLEVVSL